MNAAKRDDNAYSKSKIEELELQNRELREKLNNYEDDGKDNWTIFKEEFNRDMEELSEALTNLTVRNTR
jgi:hypothetical protein